jgi:ABC-type multidrug transport system permease subunit
MKSKSKKNLHKLLLELVFTLVVAALLSIVLAFFALFVLANLNVPVEYRSYVNFVSGALFGLFVGYKLKTLVVEYKKN